MDRFRSIFSKIFTSIFNRLTIIVVLFLAQVVYFGFIIYRFAAYATWINMGFRAVSVLFALYIIWRPANPEYKIGMILGMAIFPEMGVMLFLLFGMSRRSRTLSRRIGDADVRSRQELKQQSDIAGIRDRRRRGTIRYLNRWAGFPAWDHTTARYYPVGDTMFRDMLEDLKHAEHFIFLEYFIVSRGELWDAIYAILKEKAASGVDVRLIYDDIGSIHHIPRHIQRDLKADGIRVMAFNTVKPFLSLVYNNRDHRKISVIDGWVGYTGGANVADEYVNRIVRFGHWKDAGVRLEGEGVWNLTVMFLTMWNAFSEDDADFSMYRPHVWHPEPFPSDGMIQPFSDSPLDDEQTGENTYIDILNQARHYVYIYTPYLIIDDDMERALRLAAKRGVDVRIVTPGIPDKPLIFAITRSYYRSLMEAGVKIYEYTPGFIHAKCCLSDDQVAVVGTINFDYRSFYLHFECGCLFTETESVIRDLSADCRETLRRSRQVRKDDLKKHPFGTMAAFFFRIFSPLF
ncbi:cardiolipin synthase [Eubacterium pyruvativorans]|uniref:cardiolipin synthase n=1 Tax=Eubacterium pyruvativorans TaxID=155865 RepID=UPI0023F410A6|nr:cardiolipin synthase [Eubacterium pyruvativorans]MCI5746651.1 cardiolipin synthase [Eubacterium pyruvativorans]MDY4050229.1 cardiolipin synthase [Eubacterium pyruvativorans]